MFVLQDFVSFASLSSSNVKVKLLFEARSLGSLPDLLMVDDFSGQHACRCSLCLNVAEFSRKLRREHNNLKKDCWLLVYNISSGC